MIAVTETADSIDVVELGRAVRRGWRALAICTLLGIAIGLAVLLFAPRRFGSSASVVIRSAPASGASSMLARLGFSEALPGVSSASVETETAIMASRALVGGVVDSLRLQASVESPKSIAARAVVSELRLPGSFQRAVYDAERTANGAYRLTSDGREVTATPGSPTVLPQGTIVLRADTTLPATFSLALLDREDAITNVEKRLSVSKNAPSGEVVFVGYQAPDSLTAAAVPNALVSAYLARRHTVDRGTNEYRVGFLTAQIDSVGRQLSIAEDSLRRFQEASGVLDPQVQGKIQLDQAAEIRKQLGVIDVERGALSQLTTQIASGQMTPRQIAAYPTFLSSPAINELLGQLVKIETQRTELLERRLDSDREVMALTQSAKNVESQLTTLAAGYGTSLARQRTDLAAQLDTISHALGTFPGAVESSGRLQRRAKELAQTYGALQAQLVDSRLAAIGEGGDVKLLDPATPPKKVVFPKKSTTIGIGTGAGLFVGLVLALFAGLLGRYVEDPQAIERSTGVPALGVESGIPLLVAGGQASSTLLLVPVDGRVSTAGVAERLARTAIARAIEPIVLDLSHAGSSSSMALTTDVNATIRRLEQQHGMVIVRLPSLSADETAAALHSDRAVLLVAPPGRLERRQLVGAIQTLRRLDVPCAGVVVNRVSDAITA